MYQHSVFRLAFFVFIRKFGHEKTKKNIRKNKVPIWESTLGNPVVWDYHVIFLYHNPENKNESIIFDFDTTLPFPCKG